MKKYDIFCGTELLADDVSLASTFLSRFRGLMLRRSLAPGEGLLLRGCATVHCFFMRFAIDVVYLDGGMKVTGVETIRPWRIGGVYRGTRHVLELEAGRAHALKPGTELTIKEKKDE